MGGGGGFNPIPIIATLIYGPEAGGLAATAMGAMGSSRSTADAGLAQAASEAQAAARAAEEQATQSAEECRRSERRRKEAVLLDQAKAQQRAGLVSQSSLAQTLGAPAVETSQLKEKLGQ
ncbi:MAG: hypothetical protein CVU73_15515 [Deltaproteobacteria bacterium HGW-Deltaproteobacteria-8]|jgi:hypothetical protein|nr:MAG: hypothetical protein CVU73_15515 [Deltaproteobacteria bacterium HGW-Deltaproteobacteria-8]